MVESEEEEEEDSEDGVNAANNPTAAAQKPEEDDTDCDALIEDSMNMDEAAGVLNDPKALSMMLRQQYESVQNKNSQLRQHEAASIQSNQYTSIQSTSVLKETEQPTTLQSTQEEEAKKEFMLEADESAIETQYEIDQNNPSILQVAEAEQSQGGEDDSGGVLWPSQSTNNPVTASAQQAKAKAPEQPVLASKAQIQRLRE